MLEITRYVNRKLYSAQAGAFVSSRDVFAAVKAGTPVRITDRRTRRDVTAEVLMFMAGAQLAARVPLDTVIALIQEAA